MTGQRALWLRWTMANALSELAGLGVTFATLGLLLVRVDTQQITGILFSFAIAVCSGATEATVVGLAHM